MENYSQTQVLNAPPVINSRKKHGIENTSPKVIKVLFVIFMIFVCLFAIGCIVTAIVFWNNASEKGYYSHHTYSMKETTNGALVGTGFAFFFGGLFISAIMALINIVVFGFLFDIKAIRKSVEKEEPEIPPVVVSAPAATYASPQAYAPATTYVPPQTNAPTTTFTPPQTGAPATENKTIDANNTPVELNKTK